MTVCSIADCNNHASSRGWCSMHYQRWKKRGDPLSLGQAPDGAGYVMNGYLRHTVDGKRVGAHVLIAEAALGKPLPAGAVVHHVDENRINNTPTNLVICGRSYHMLLHARMKAMAATGDPDKRRCGVCKQYDALENLRSCPSMTTTKYWHAQCAREAAAAHRTAKANLHTFSPSTMVAPR